MILQRLRERKLLRDRIRRELEADGPDGRDVGIRVERDGVWVPVESSKRALYEAPRGMRRKRLSTRRRRGPNILVYDRHRLAVRNDMLTPDLRIAFAAGERAPLVGLDEVTIVELPRELDAFDVLVEHYRATDREVPKPQVGTYRELLATERESGMDEVALLHRFWLTTHVFFWPQNQPSAAAGLPNPTWGDPRTVVVLDTGIRPQHSYFGGKATFFRDLARDDDKPLPQWPQYEGHGTGVAGAVRQRNKDAEIVGARLEEIGSRPTVEEAELVALIDQIPVQGHVVLNLSFGGPTVGERPPLYEAIVRFRAKGRCDVVAAAGNVTDAADREVVFPAAWPVVNAVASVDSQGNVHPWSNYGPWVDSRENGEVVTTSANVSTYVNWRGTSFAAPQRAAKI